jgi:hypothetical protein
MPKITFKHGTKATMPKLDFREPAITDDTEEIFIGGNTDNIQLAKQADLDTTNTNVGNLTTLQTTAKGSLVEAVNENTTALAQIAIQLDHYKTGSNTWNDAFDLAYADLPQYGGKILIPSTITITRSIDLHALGTKKVLIEGNGKMNNPGTAYNSVIIKQGDFDGVILNHGSSMRNIAVGRDTAYTDTHDGIWVAGITCGLENVQVADQGGDGIRVGSKNIDANSVSYNCNIGRFINVGAYNNAGWGIKVRDDFATGINTSNANALLFLAPDCRTNTLGGMLFENCMDNQVYSADCELNTGEAGIKIGTQTSGIDIYSAYTENPNATQDILLTTDSQSSKVLGFRSGLNNDRITDLGVGNLILGKYGSKFSGYYFKNKINALGINIGKTSTTGYFSLDQEDDNTLSIVSRGSAGKSIKTKSDTGTVDVGFITKDITLGGKDRLNSVRLRPQVTTVDTVVPAYSSVSANRTALGVKVGDVVKVNPYTPLPNGIDFYELCDVDDNVKITLINSTSASVTVPAQNWRCVAFTVTALT